MMRRFQRTAVLCAVVLCAAVLATLLAGCAADGGQTTTKGNSTPQATQPSTRPKPTSLPKIDADFCGRIVTLAEANKIMGKTTEAKTIRVIGDEEGGSCNYEFSTGRSVVSVAFFPGQGDLSSMTSALTSNPDWTGSVKPVSGLGDAARFIINPIPNTPIKQDHLWVAYGAVFMDCFDPSVTVGDDVELGKLTEVAKLIIGQL